MQVDDLREIPSTDNQNKKKKKKKREKIDAAESTEETQMEEKKKKIVDEVMEDIDEQRTNLEEMGLGSDEKKKKKKKKKKKRDREEGENKSSTSPDGEETTRAQKKGKKEEKSVKIESLSTEVEKTTSVGDKEKIDTEESKGSGTGNKKRKGTINGAGDTDKKKRKKKDQMDGATDISKPSPGKTKKVTKDKVGKKAKATTWTKKKSVDKPEMSRAKEKEKSKSRRVSFSGDVEVFPPSNDSDSEEYDESNLVRGKRFSKEEDQLIRDAVQKYIDINQLGEEGLQMVLKSSKYPQVRGCWKEICAAIPWRPAAAVYARGHSIFERSEKRGFSKEENEVIKKFHAEYGPRWKKLSEVLGKQMIHIKDAWRRIRLPNMKKGRWSQDEYQSLFDMVNLDLRMKAFEERKSDNNMIRENISWEAISDKLSTRTMSGCCHKWYDQLTSPLVRQGLWADADDYRLLDALQKQDGCNVEDIDWDSLVDGRSWEVCQKRWGEMVRHIGGYRERTFIEQLDVLTKRYCGDIPQHRFKTEAEEDEDEEE